MECNKDEASRAKDIADRKFTEKDYNGAKKFALKAQNLYPELEGLSHMLTILDVHISAEKRLCGETDWYAVLGVTPFANVETIRKQYRKLALMLHPDKNKSIGADGAFKLVSEAWSLLSDEAKRQVFHMKLVPKESKISFPPPSANGFHDFTSGAPSYGRTHNKNARVRPTPTPVAKPQKRTDTFWTMCNRCRTQYEYLRIYLNHTLLCPSCNKAFFASEKDPPQNVNNNNKVSFAPHQHPSSSSHHATNNSNQFHNLRNSGVSQTSERGQWNPSSSQMTGVGSSSASPTTAAQAASVVQQAHEKLVKNEEGLRAAESEKLYFFKRMSDSSASAERSSKNRRVDHHGGPMENQMASGMGLGSSTEFRRGSFEGQRTDAFSVLGNKQNIERELSVSEIQQFLLRKAVSAISAKLEEWRLESKAKAVEKERMGSKENEKKKQKHVLNGNVNDNKQSASEESMQQELVLVPDSDFYNFDLDRVERSFAGDQIWAAYDENDGMPRLYARIRKVISFKPFKMQINFLNSKSNIEFGPQEWVEYGFPKTCGIFRVGKLEISERLNSFSHRVSWNKGPRGTINIYPTKGKIWALYRNWSPNWNEHTHDEVVHKYDMVEVLDEYDEEKGVSIAPLIKVCGFRTVFQKNADPKEVKRIPKEEMFRFSHQVPSYLLTGEEAKNAPKGCLDLDPAAIPLELLQVITEKTDVPLGEINGTTAKPEDDKGTA